MTFTNLEQAGLGYTDPLYHYDVYGYLPGMLLLGLPALLIGDPRWLMLPMVPLAAFCLRGVARSAGASPLRADLVTLAFATYPGLPWIVREAFVEPPIVLAFLGGLWAVICGRYAWAIAGAVVFLSIKQYTPPLLLTFWAAGLGLKRIALASVIVLAIFLPFIVWSPTDFLWDTFTNLLHLQPRPDATSLNGYLLARFDLNLPGWLTVGPPLVGGAYAAWRAWRGDDWRTVLRLTAGMYFLLFLFNKFAYANYYFLLQAVLLVAAGVAAANQPRVVESER
jgi:hypothetical protein